MKNQASKLLSAAVLLGAMASVTVACKSKKGKPIEKQSGATEISVPFTGKDYETNKETFRENVHIADLKDFDQLIFKKAKKTEPSGRSN